MRRLMYFLLLVLLVSASATCVNASTDCERWFAAYRSEMAHSQQLKRIAAAKRRASLYARRKLAGYVRPAHKPKPTVRHTPRMPHREAVRHIDLACGVLPESVADQPVISEEEPSEFAAGHLPDDEVGLLPGFDGPGQLLSEEASTAPAFSEAPPAYGGGGPIFAPPFSSPVNNKPGTPPLDGPPPPVSPPAIAPVPEPGSFALMLTGFAGAAGVVRRRWTA
jgi:hypothetical protein